MPRYKSPKGVHLGEGLAVEATQAGALAQQELTKCKGATFVNLLGFGFRETGRTGELVEAGKEWATSLDAVIAEHEHEDAMGTPAGAEKRSD
jgi:hypothetical protein